MPEKKKSVVPRLRFPEFRDAGEWEVKRLGKAYRFIPTNSLSRDKLNYAHGTVKNIHYGDIHTKFRPLFDINNEDVPYVNDGIRLEQFDQNAFCTNGDVIFADASEDVDDIGKAIEIINTDGKKLISGLHTLHARPRDQEFVLGFLGYLFQTIAIREQIRRESQGAKVLGISAKRLATIKIFVPRKNEQQKIADCLSSLDEVIDLEVQKLDALKAHKKGLMQQLFPREGETTPRLRFPAFRNAGAWEIASLKMLAIRRTERNSDGKLVRVLTNSAEHGVIDQRDYFDKDIAVQGNLNNYHIVDKGDFVYNPRISAFAPVGPISRNNIVKGVMSPLYTIFCFNNPNSDFYAHYFKSSAWHSYLRKVGSTGARHDRMAISNDDFMAMRLPAPLPKEQQKIADCLSSLDEVIDLEAQKLDALKAHKKGLMQQLFPQEVD